jgi:hypothetical protein
VTAADYEISAPVAAAAAPLATVSDFDRAARGLTNPPDLTALGSLLGQLVMARLEPLPERQVLAAIKSATGIAVSILEKQIAELRRRLNATGDVHQRPDSTAAGRASSVSTSRARLSATRPTSSPRSQMTRPLPALLCSTSSARRP